MSKTASTGGEGLDTFANMEPIDLNNDAAAAPTQTAQDPLVESFDSDEVILPDSMKEEDTKGEQDAEKQESSEESEETEKSENKGTLENKEKDEDDEGTEKEESGKEGDDSSEEETEQDSQEDSGNKPEGKTIRVKNGDESLDLDEKSTVPVRVKGKKEFVSLSELTKNYSGHKAWSEEIETAKAQKAEVEIEREQFNTAREQTKEHFVKIGSMLNDAFENPEADPLSAMKYLVELSGRNVLDFEKRIMEHSMGLSNQFAELDENQQQLYWTQRENEILKNNQATQAKQFEDRKAQEQRVQQLNQVREQYGVSEQDYEAAQNAIAESGYDLKEVSPEKISKYAALQPLVREANELCQEFEDDLSDAEMTQLVTGTADTKFKFPELSSQEALKLAAKRMGYEIELTDDLLDEVKEKVQKPEDKSRKTSAKRAVEVPEGHMESFDDFDTMYYSPRS